MNSLKQRVSSVETKSSKLEESVDFMSNIMDDIQKDGGLNAVRSKLSVTEAKTAEIEQITQNTNARLTVIEQRDPNTQSARDAVLKMETEMKRHTTMIKSMARRLDHLKREKTQTDDKLTELQYHTMKMNLVFTGLSGEFRGENTEQKLREFLRNELDLDHYIEFVNIHRFGRFQRGKPRPIVARFIYQSDVSTVIERANWLRGTPWGVHRQFPAAIDERRRTLIPVMRLKREEGAAVKLVRDRLYINGHLYDPESYDSDNSDWDPVTVEPMDYAGAVRDETHYRDASIHTR